MSKQHLCVIQKRLSHTVYLFIGLTTVYSVCGEIIVTYYDGMYLKSRYYALPHLLINCTTRVNPFDSHFVH